MWHTLISGTLEQGLIYSIMALGVYLSFRVLNHADLSVDGSLPLGAAIAASLIVRGIDPAGATLLAFWAGLWPAYLPAFSTLNLKFRPSFPVF